MSKKNTKLVKPDKIIKDITNLMLDNREATDSTLENRPIFKTRNGREVYGGGGITPDIYSTSKLNLNKNTQMIYTSPERYIFKYAQFIKNKIYVFQSFEHFYNYIQGNNLDINKFVDWFDNQSKKPEMSIENIDENWGFIENRIFAEIAGLLWGKDYLYHVLLEEDTQFQEAILNIDRAKEIMY